MKASACELVLEALVAERKISRSSSGGYTRAQNETPPTGKGYQGFDPFGA